MAGHDEGAKPRRSRRVTTGRQDREPGRPRTVRHVVKVHRETEDRLAERAREHGITVSRLLVESALAGGSDVAAMKREMYGELFRITRLLGKVGVNINQITKATNATLEEQPEAAAACEAITRVCARVEAWVDDVERRL